MIIIIVVVVVVINLNVTAICSNMSYKSLILNALWEYMRIKCATIVYYRMVEVNA